jgi:hypothetical protein
MIALSSTAVSLERPSDDIPMSLHHSYIRLEGLGFGLSHGASSVYGKATQPFTLYLILLA